MTGAVRVVLGVLLPAHGLVHLLYLAPDVDAFSFDSTRLPEPLRRPVGLVLLGTTVVAFVLVALAAWHHGAGRGREPQGEDDQSGGPYVVQSPRCRVRRPQDLHEHRRCHQHGGDDVACG